MCVSISSSHELMEVSWFIVFLEKNYQNRVFKSHVPTAPLFLHHTISAPNQQQYKK